MITIIGTSHSSLNSAAHIRLFCFPYAGGGATLFRQWSNYLPAEVQVCPVQLPGRGNLLQDPPFVQISPLVQALAETLQPYVSFPFAFFGHSMGALICFELSRYLRDELGLCPVHLFVSAYRAPQLPSTHPPVSILPDLAFIKALWQLNGTPEAVLQNTELMQLLLPTLRADFVMCEAYTYEVEDPLPCPISAFGGQQDYVVSNHELQAWSEQTSGSFKLRMLPGDHFFLNRSQQELLRAIAEDLNGV